jgi:hypothetical protein
VFENKVEAEMRSLEANQGHFEAEVTFDILKLGEIN